MANYHVDNRTLKIKSFFIVILGERDDNINHGIINRMNQKGNCVQIMDKTYVLSILSDNIVTTTDLRLELSGEKNYILIVFKLDTDTAAAWCLKTENSNYLKSVFNEIKEN